MPKGQGDDPFRDLLSLQERMNRLFEDSLARSVTPEEEQPVGTWWPAVDILETEGELVLKAELPGISLEGVDLQIQNDVLMLSGERRFDQGTKKANYHRAERAYGKFSRSFKLPSIIDKARIEARLKDGILEVRLPKILKKKSRSIPIDTKES